MKCSKETGGKRIDEEHLEKVSFFIQVSFRMVVFVVFICFFFLENLFFISYALGYFQTNIKGKTLYTFRNDELYLGPFKTYVCLKFLFLTLLPPLFVFVRSS